MIKFKATHPNSYNEYKQGISLAVKIFGYSSYHTKIYFLDKDKYNYKNSIIIKNDKNKIIAFSILIYKKINLYEKNLKTAFLTSICVDQKYRNKGLSRILLNKSFETAKKNNCSSILLIARKNTDYFYNKFNFWGISKFPKIIINKKNFNNTSFNIKLSSSIINKFDIFDISQIYVSEYSKLLGYFNRSNDYWKYIIYRCKNEKINLKKYKFKNKIIGYVAFKDNEVHEIAATNKIYYLFIVNDLLNKNKFIDLNLLFNKHHNIYKFLEDIETSYVTRNINFGGHMLKIIDELKFKNFLFANKKILKSQYKMNIKKMTLSFISNNKFLFDSKNQMLNHDFYINYLDHH